MSPRPRESVVLRDDLMSELITDVQAFIDSEKMYAQRGFPWHRGYLLYGPPGVGKSSLARVLSTEFKRNLYYLPVGDCKSDSDLLSRVSDIDHGILLLEDIDSITAATRRDDSKGVTTAGLLNALDGVGTPDGLITIMTTNHYDRLDPALIRPGRVDKAIYLDYLDSDQMRRLVKNIVGVECDIEIEPGTLTAATVVELGKQFWHEPEVFIREIQKWAK